MFLLGSLMSRIPLSALAGVLMVTAWRMNDWQEIKTLFHNRVKTKYFTQLFNYQCVRLFVFVFNCCRLLLESWFQLFYLF